MIRLPILARCCVFSVLFATFAGAATAAAADRIQTQRQLFLDVYESVERGNWNPISQLPTPQRELLEAYVLWPDLHAAWLRANLKRTPAAEIDDFLQQYGVLRPARDVRYRHALNLARKGDLAAYQRIYEQFYQGQEIENLDCLALQAELAAGRQQRVVGRALDLWLVGKSQVAECDPVFEYLNAQNILGPFEYQKRYKLAIDNREFSLARWLGKRVDQQHVDAATQWLAAQNNPEAFLKKHLRAADSTLLQTQLAYAVERLTFKDPVIALQLWRKVSARFNFSTAQKLGAEQHIALWTARDKLPGAYELLANLADAAQSDEVLRWRARTSLHHNNWKTLLIDIALMSTDERGTDEWRYWRAVALLRTGQTAAGNADLATLSLERSYYGFLAADELGKSYALEHAGLLADEAAITAIAARPEVVRARELYYVGLDGRGRSEWDAVTRYLRDDEKTQAAILANRWGWHSRAIATVASLGEYDDLSLRYPLPYQQSFEASSSKASIAATWAYGIARSESLFMRDVRSHAGAIGLMQLMPATGREVARDLRLPYSGVATLTDPDINIRLGTSYLGQMAARYDGHSVPATAAYNAGPHRVDRWLPENGSIDARIWIENIPFNETRKYVKRVLAAQTIFHWRLTGKIRRLSAELPVVQAASDTERVAAR